MGFFTHDAADDVSVTATFPESNPLGQLVNGERNNLLIHLANSGKKNYTVVSASASYHDPLRNWALVKNQTISRINVPLVSGSNYSAPFNVYSEHRPSEVGLTVWVNLADGTTREIVPITAFNQTVSVVEPPTSWLDPSLLLVYSLLLAALGAGAWLAYQAFVDNSSVKKGNKRVVVKKAVVVAKQENQVYPNVKPYEEEWIPAHLLKGDKTTLKKRGAGKVPGASSGAEELTSGGEFTSGAETSGAEGRVKKTKGKKGSKKA